MMTEIEKFIFYHKEPGNFSLNHTEFQRFDFPTKDEIFGESVETSKDSQSVFPSWAPTSCR